ncbi:MAG: ATP-dependent protease ATPase subunit HslU [Oligoflexia bacterium]|nr:ATP-dependent protease ATPase subunit HslU [Oligoflexia bacterium]
MNKSSSSSSSSSALKNKNNKGPKQEQVPVPEQVQAPTLTPREIVEELDRYIIGQNDAKKAVAIALRNRWRRQKLDENLKEEVQPKNILMIGPTGVGKTEIAKRLAKLVNAPFIKVEATKYTEIGYVGRDVEQIIRDLIEISISLTKELLRKNVEINAKGHTEKRILDAIESNPEYIDGDRQYYHDLLAKGELNDMEIEIKVNDNANLFPTFDIPGMPGAQIGMMNIGDALGKAFGTKTKNRRIAIKEAYKIIMNEESDKLLDQEKMIQDAITAVEQNGIVFIDEFDKICARSERQSGGADVSREGVQRDLLPLIEGTSVLTKHGTVRTNHILFIASGAFHVAKPADLLPELQGRLPIRVELAALTADDFINILTETEANLIKQYKALMATEGVNLNFTPEAIKEIASLAFEINQNVENIGARRLHTVLEKMLEEISFKANENEGKTIKIDAKYVSKTVGDLAKRTDLSKFIL